MSSRESNQLAMQLCGNFVGSRALTIHESSLKEEKAKVMDNNKPASKMNSNRQPEFSGHIGNINISGAGIHYQFDLVNNKKVRNAYMLSTANLTGFAAMVSFFFMININEVIKLCNCVCVF